MPQKRLHYRICAHQPGAHLFRVSCSINQPATEGQVFSLPTWIPGSYMIRDFAKNVVSLTAESEGVALAVTREDKSHWRCAPCQGPLTLHYEIYAWDLSVRTAHLDQNHGFFNGSSVFLLPNGYEEVRCEVEIQPPDGEVIGNWRVATGLNCDDAEGPNYQFGHYSARNYDELIDCPVEMGDFTLAHFQAGDIPHDVVITGHHRTDMKRLCQDLQTICQHHINFFSELPTMERYTFLIMAVGDGYGGLEHRNSTSLLCRRDDLPAQNMEEASDTYVQFLGLCSHEYFHTWNIKRIKPAVFLPYDLSRETYTRQLWAFEGFTSYYDDLGLLRCGLISATQYLELLGQVITRVWLGKGRFKQSVSDSSFDAWTKFYKQDENAPNAIVSYYTKGSLIALALDLTLRRLSEGRHSLDELMQRLWQEYGKPYTGVPEGCIETLASELAGEDLSPFFQRYLHGLEDPPLAELLKEVGIDMHLRAAESLSDKGGKPADKATFNLGMRYQASSGGLSITHVLDGGDGQRAGISANDLIIAIDGLKTSNSLEKQLQGYRVGDRLAVHLFRRDELMQVDLCLSEAEKNVCYLKLMEEADVPTQARRRAWLKHDA